MGSMGSIDNHDETGSAMSLLVFLVVLFGGAVLLQVLSRLFGLGAGAGVVLFSALPIAAALTAVRFTARHPSA